jgi:serine/threonine protein kinase
MSANIHSTSQQPHDESRLEKYSLGSVIGKGSYAIVRMGTNKANNYKVAIKVYDK